MKRHASSLLIIVSLTASQQAYSMTCAELFESTAQKARNTVARVTGRPELRVKAAKRFVPELMAAQFQAEMTSLLLKRYPELKWLTGAVDATPEGRVASTKDKSPSEAFFGEKHIEFDRSVTGIFLLKWILTGNYEAFTAPQKGAAKMTKENFAHLKQYTESILSSPESVDAMITYMVINDLGKIRSIVSEVQSRTGLRDVDHDNILLVALERHPEISPSFQRLPRHTQQIMVRGLQASFNIGQFLQGENVPASLTGLKGLDKESLDFYLLHAIADIGGAAGHVTSNGSIVMSNPTYEGFKSGVRAIEGLNRGRTEVEVYNDFLADKGRPFGLQIENPKDRVITRLVAMLRASDAETVNQIREVFDSLPKNVQAILLKEMNLNGVNDGFATLLYYSPATLANLIGALKEARPDSHFKDGLAMGLTTLAEVYQHGRIMLKGREGDGVFTVLISAVAEAAKSPEKLDNSRIDLKPVENDAEAVLLERTPINSANFPRIDSLSQIPGKKVGVIGIGGGSDGVQAAQLSLLLKNSGKDIPFVISVRTAKTESQGAGNRSGEARTIENHGGEIAEGVFRVLPESQGSGRFLENIPASEVNMFLVIDTLDGKLAQKIQAVIKHVGGSDTVIGVDTGGDALFSMSGSQGINKSKSTPDQDLRVLSSLSELKGVSVMSGIIATGVDTPLNAEAVLQSARASYYELSRNETDTVLERYHAWDMTGNNDRRFGKTPLTWQLALTGQRGLQVIGLPTRVVTDSTNPWNPFMRVDDSMAGIFFMNLEGHIEAISK
ncbi:MAG: DUF1152 domain-containing protein [Bdellovibrionales bacterium]|nr:DUF1152 domain-containing protein [Bdellovibrionales bacterium]